MQRITTTIAIVASLLAFVGAQTCQECQTDNDVYCHNQTSYQNCMKNAAFGDIETCPTGTICSNSADVCVDSSLVDGSTVLDVCGTSGGNGALCEVCQTNAKYACVSNTQYARCSSSGALIASTVYSCDVDELCIIDALSGFGTLCVPTCASDYVGWEATCSNSVYQPITTTAAPTTTPSAAQNEQACRNAEPSNSPKYFYTRNYDDSTCNSYLYCQKSGTDNWLAIYMSCVESRPFFDASISNCVVTRPASCSDTTTSTSTAAPPATDAPTDATDAPTDATDAPTDATDAPTDATDGPTDATDAPTDATDAPDAPTDATDAPTDATDDPTDPSDAPTDATDAPDAPTDATDAPDAPTDATDDPTDAPTDATDSPTDATDAPTDETDAPTGS